MYRKLGISPIVMSAGELESGNAGEPAKLVRQRYREAADIIKKGNMCSLFINDLDAGAGRMGGGTQYTVNNQMVCAHVGSGCAGHGTSAAHNVIDASISSCNQPSSSVTGERYPDEHC